MSDKTLAELKSALLAHQDLGDDDSVLYGAYYVDAFVEGAEARVKELEALQQEQESIVLGVGPILCRNQVNHPRFDGCIYCKVTELEEDLSAQREETTQSYITNAKLTEENRKLREAVKSYDGHALFCSLRYAQFSTQKRVNQLCTCGLAVQNPEENREALQSHAALPAEFNREES